FLVHDRRLKKEPDVIKIPEWNINAQPVPFIRLLLENTQKVCSENFYIRIPTPEAFFFHKLIIAQRRRREEKREKDLRQCEALSRILDDERLRQVITSERLSKDTKRKIKRSCETIYFQNEHLEQWYLP
ncbi:MAG: GSU2403 family nucleotidyltransferase fold protein, partial [Syntrophaceae bacterium]|nr:GSU2403 family nucleotidyltransferase fold protein [Syntrophaceae bacterium]